jgi:hypothetical protein
MNRKNRSHSLLLIAAALTVVIGLPGLASADEPVQGQWLAAITEGHGVKAEWGRLVLKDGSLSFHGARDDWHAPVSDITRITIARDAERSFRIETVSGDVVVLAILGPHMLKESPKKAMQLIQRAVRESAPSTTLTVASAQLER